MPPALITAFDTDNDQGWNLDEYSTAMQDKSLVAWRRVFDIVDADLSGIPEAEKEMNYSEIAIEGMDEDGDGDIDFGELQAYLSEL